MILKVCTYPVLLDITKEFSEAFILISFPSAKYEEFYSLHTLMDLQRSLWLLCGEWDVGNQQWIQKEQTEVTQLSRRDGSGLD